MKSKFLISLTLISLFSCNQKKEELSTTPHYNDSLLVVKNNDVNKFIRDYAKFEENYVKAYETDDRGLLQIYTDSVNYYDKKAFSKEIIGKMDNVEKVQFNNQINKIRTKKINRLFILHFRKKQKK